MKALANCGMSSAANRANMLLQRMENSYHKGNTRLKPDLLSYNTVLDAFSKEGDAKSAERLLSRMITTDDVDIKPDAHSYTSGKSALVLFYHVHMCVQCEVLVIWLNFICPSIAFICLPLQPTCTNICYVYLSSSS